MFHVVHTDTFYGYMVLHQCHDCLFGSISYNFKFSLPKSNKADLPPEPVITILNSDDKFCTPKCMPYVARSAGVIVIDCFA